MTQLLLHANNEWFVLRQGQITPSLGVPTLTEPAVVLSFASKTQVGAMEVEGRRKHLRAIVEHRLSSTGTVYGSTYVELHHTGKRQRGYTVLYSAIPADEAEFMGRWEDEQTVPVVTVAFMTWMWRQVAEDEAVLCQMGTSTFFLGRQDGRIFHLGVKAFSEAMSDVQASWEALVARIRGMRMRGEPWLDESVLRVRWFPACAYREANWSVSREAEEAGAVFGALFPDMGFDEVAGTNLGSRMLVSALPGKASTHAVVRSSRDWPGLFVWASANYEHRWIALAWVACAAVLIGAVEVHTLAEQTRAELMQISAEAIRQEQAIATLSGKMRMPPQYDDWARQLATQQHTLEQVDVNRIFADVGGAAQVAGVTIVRLHTVVPSDLSKANRSPASGKRPKVEELSGGVGVEGLLSDDGLTPVNDQLSRFVAAMRGKGYTMQSVPTQTSQVTAGLSGRLFAYVMREPSSGSEQRL
ncbi:hypothetical protein [Burkholderia gladioli]|uniref:hypothetical protein n=1 Tax=Burkholderia gladioli TaxID=28095 RepID=UPI00163ECE54|nr:hypothetical protein [Burkholderia gladioli]